MKKLVIEIDESLLPKLLNVIQSFPQQKVKINFEKSQSEVSGLTYEEFERKWAGLLSEDDIKNFKNQRVKYLIEKHLQ